MIIQLNAISKRFGRRPALRSVNLESGGGTIVALLGANGAGKTTLLKIAATLTRPDRGTYRAFGANAFERRSEVRRELGYVAHRPFVYPELTCAENLRFFARLFDVDDPETTLSASLEYVGLADRADRPAYSLSRGLLQRLDLARALLHNPTLLIFDEPDTGLDVRGRDLLQQLMRDRAGSGCLVLFTSHALDFAVSTADRVVTLVDGAIAVDQPATTLGAKEVEQLIHHRETVTVG